MKTSNFLLLASSALLWAGGCASQQQTQCCPGSHLQPIHAQASNEPAAADSIEGQLLSKGKAWSHTAGEITEGAFVEDVLKGRLHQPAGRGSIGKVQSLFVGDDGKPRAMVDFGRGYSVGIFLSELSLIKIVSR